MSIKQKLEHHYKISLELIYLEIHIKNKISLNQISKDTKIIRQSIAHCFRVHGFIPRNIKEATSLTKNFGSNHYAFGKTNEAHSKRMIDNNPMLKKENRIKANVGLAKNFNAKMLPQEIKFKEILDSQKVEFITQYLIDVYIIDFYIPKINLCIEIDSKLKWGKEKIIRAEKKDTALRSLGFKVLRICKSKLDSLDFVLNILKTNNVIL